MDGFINNFNVRAAHINPVENPAAQAAHLPRTEISGFKGNFKKALDDAIHKQQTVNFSKHANARMNDRQINLTGEQLNRVEVGLSMANAKGIRDSLVLVDDVALVVNVKSKTVVTAMESGQDNVFSNIDGAVIV